MLKHLSRSGVIKAWFAAVAFLGAGIVAFGAPATIATMAMILLLCLVPPVIVLMLWPGAQAATAAEVLRGGDGRG
jgi:hypothetical protein